MRSKKAPILKSSRIKVGITFGDPAGIGPAIIRRALPFVRGLADFTVIGDYALLKEITPGKASAECGRLAIAYLDRALKLLKQKEIDCLVTCPVSKEAVNLAGFNFLGHTEYLADKTDTRDFAMLLLNDRIKTVLVTRHLAIKKVPLALSRQNIIQTVLLTDKYLKRWFAISSPSLVACGLNPHASDNGLLGEEENRIIKPALAFLRKKNIRIDGPLPADIAAAKAVKQEYDCLVAMYHDQALIPLKLTGAESGVNLTLGLPFVRTSPLHGTAFDIAASPRLAKPDSLVAAIKLAIRCTLNQKKA